MGTILLYGFEALTAVLAVKGVADLFSAEVKPVWGQEHRQSIGALAGLRPRKELLDTTISWPGERMMVFCDMDAQIDALLPALRQAGVGIGSYKAVLTIHNQEWDGLSLLAELQTERAAIERQRGK